MLDAGAQEHKRIILGVVLSFGFCLVAFLLNWLSLEGVRAGTILGSLVFGLGGFSTVYLVLFFFISSTLLSREEVFGRKKISYVKVAEPRRDGLQVWSNGFWFSLFLVLGTFFESDTFWIASIGALGTATADTWATELGSKRFKAKTWFPDDFTEVEPGTEGGISMPGTLAAMGGSTIISLLAVLLFSLKSGAFLILFTAGFLGCLADSYFGAVFQGKGKVISLTAFNKQKQITVDNNLVNWLATGVGSLTAIILTLVF